MNLWLRQSSLLVLLVFLLLACGNPQEEARIKLGQMNVKYNEDTFVDRQKRRYHGG